MQIKLKNNLYDIVKIAENYDVESSIPEVKIYFNNLTYSDLKNLFVKGDKWSVLVEKEKFIYNEETKMEEVQMIIEEYDCKDYCIPGVITDYQDGILSIEMKKISINEIMPSKSIKESQDFINEALRLSFIIDDSLAIEYPNLFFEWRENTFYKENDRINYNNTLYKVLNDHTSSENPTIDLINYK
jgi:hypothetical protein